MMKKRHETEAGRYLSGLKIELESVLEARDCDSEEES